MAFANSLFGVFLFCATVPAIAASLSGFYLSVSKDNGYLSLELIESKDGSVTGRYRQVDVTDKGVTVNLDAPVSGSGQQGRLVGRIERPWYQGGVLAFSGSRTREGVQIAGGDGLKANLKSATKQEEHDVIEILSQRAKYSEIARQAIKERKSLDREAKNGVDRIVEALDISAEFQSRGEKTVSTLNKVPVHYEKVINRQMEIAEKARRRLGREHRLETFALIQEITAREITEVGSQVDNSKETAKGASNNAKKALTTAEGICSRRDKNSSYESEYVIQCSRIPSARVAVDSLTVSMESTFRKLEFALASAESKSAAIAAEFESAL